MFLRGGEFFMDQPKQYKNLQDLAQGGQQKGIVIPPEIRGFLEGILADANMTSLDEQMHEEMIEQLFVRLDNFIISRIVEALPADKLDEFIGMQEKGAQKPEVEAYIKQHIPDAQQVFTDAFTEFRQIYLRNVSVARNAPGESDALVEEEKPEEK